MSSAEARGSIAVGEKDFGTLAYSATRRFSSTARILPLSQSQSKNLNILNRALVNSGSGTVREERSLA